jgi:HEAT repeat protein
VEPASLVEAVRNAQTVDAKCDVILRCEAHGNEAFVGPLAEILLDESQDADVRFVAASALQWTRSPKAVAPLAKIVLDYGLNFYPNDNSEGWEGRIKLADWAITCLGWCGEAAAPVLLRFLEEDVIEGWHSRFITALGETGSVEALEVVHAYLGREDGSRSQAALALGDIVGNVKEDAARMKTKETLMRLAADEDHSVRSNAVESLSAFPEDRDVVALLERIAREDPYTTMMSHGDFVGEGYPVRLSAQRSLEDIRMQLEHEAAQERQRAGELAYAAQAQDFIRQFEHPTFDGQRESALWNMGWYARTICAKDSLTTDDMAALDHLQQVFESIKDSGNEEERTTARAGLATIEQRLAEPAKRGPRDEGME